MPYLIDTFPEAQKLLNIITNSNKFKKKFGGSFGQKHITELERLKKAASVSPNPINFLSNLARIYDPDYKMWKPNMKVPPGKAYDLPVPDIKLSPSAAKHLPDTQRQAKAKALQDKIAAHNAEIERLRQAQDKAIRSAEKARKQHEKLITMLDEQTLKYFAYIGKTLQ